MVNCNLEDNIMKIQLYMYSKYFTCEGILSKVHSGEIKAQAAGMGEKMLEGKTLQQVGPELHGT